VNTPIGCAAGNLSMAWALDRLHAGDVELAVAGGLDVIGAGAAATFDMLGNLSETAARPFDVARDGIIMGEGGAMLVFEPLEVARARGARVLAEFVSAGCAHDAEHQIRPALDGRGLAAALRRALLEGGLQPGDVGYVNAHAPGTAVNDPCEAAAYRSVFGARGVPVGSTKAAVGHAQGGANGLEAAACVLALMHQVIPPTLGLEQLDPALELDAVSAARKGPLEVVVSSASAMGGANAAVIFRRAP
jgi:3-oxoacyl-[acyl-carrier-protein] synthase II